VETAIDPLAIIGARLGSFDLALVLLAREPDEGNNLHLAARNIEEFLQPLALKTAQRSELEWMREAIAKEKRLIREFRDCLRAYRT
jgi:hypothetical protein